MTFSSKDNAIGRQLFFKDSFEYNKISKAVAILQSLGYSSESWLVDVGANIGTVCIPSVRTGVFRRALAFEPESRNYTLLQQNVRNNGLSEAVQTFNIALSDSTGEMEMELSKVNFGDHRLRISDFVATEERYKESQRAIIKVPVRPLGDVLRALGVAADEIGLLWIDTQGHDYHVMRGAPQLLASGIPAVCEFWPYGMARAGVSAEDFLNLVESHFAFFYDLAESDPRKRSVADLANWFDYYRGNDFSDLFLSRR
jgi:FkbM family methyltransferase